MSNIPLPDFFRKALEDAYQPIAAVYGEIIQAQIEYNKQAQADAPKCTTAITTKLVDEQTAEEALLEKLEQFLNAAVHINALQGGYMQIHIEVVTNFLRQKIESGKPITLRAISDINLAHHYEPFLCNATTEPAILRIARAEGYTLFAGFFDKLAWAICNNHLQTTHTQPDPFYIQSKTSELIRQYLAESKEPVMQAVAIG